ncbi:MAG: DUF2314 domain-containing protein [Gammaproteobacteria bacterium]|nr:DUF2314 domain-containing protein [Gammaproteobacteria bacterium]MDH5654138.1 DUF2314 domain-containing protein [Gammaproteobacteria bacterium]
MKIKSMVVTLCLLAISIPFNVYAEDDDLVFLRALIYVKDKASANKLAQTKAKEKNTRRVKEIKRPVTGIVYQYQVTTDLKNTYPLPDTQSMQYFSRGFDQKSEKKVRKYKAALIIDFAYPLKQWREGLQIFYRRVAELAKSEQGFIYDSETRELYTEAAWQKYRLESWHKDIPIAKLHIIIHAYQTNINVRAITLGMAKFGLPDIVVEEYARSINQGIGNLINVVAQSMVEGHFPEGDVFRIDLNQLADTPYKKELLKSLKKNATGKLAITVGDARRDEGDPDNYLLGLIFVKDKSKPLHETQEAMLTELFGSEDSITYIKHNDQILQASARAKAKLPALRQDFNNKLQPGEYIMLKAPFATHDGSNEWMWVEVFEWQGETIKGILKNEPFNVPGLKAGAEVTINQGDVFDYIRYYPDGRAEGNETGELIRKLSDSH